MYKGKKALLALWWDPPFLAVGSDPQDIDPRGVRSRANNRLKLVAQPIPAG